MTPEELMRPRYKVILKAPGCFKVGAIIEKRKYASDNWYVPHYGYDPDEYPDVFKKLEWWEERKLEEMPEYVKVTREECVKDTGLYCKVYKWSVYDGKPSIVAGQFGAEIEGYRPSYLDNAELNFPGQIYGRLNVCHLQPATREEYEQYLKQKEATNE